MGVAQPGRCPARFLHHSTLNSCTKQRDSEKMPNADSQQLDVLVIGGARSVQLSSAGADGLLIAELALS